MRNSKKRLRKKLANLINTYADNTHMLADFLIENNYISEDFKNKIMKSTKLEEQPIIPRFKNVREMQSFFSGLVDDLEGTLMNEKIISLKNRLDSAILCENYEEACKIRDQILKNTTNNNNKI